MAGVSEIPDGFPGRLDAVLRQLHLTPSQAALACGVSHQSFCRIAAGETAPSIGSLVKICEGLGVSADWLLFGKRIK